MRRERIITNVLLVLLLFSGGCGTIAGKPSLMFAPPEQKRKLASALEFLRAGNEKQAREVLEQVTVAPPLGGVTDEAIFRLALLHLGDGGKDAARSRALLERLKGEFPASPWTHQAAPLISYLAGAKTLRDRDGRELKALRDLNLSLTRDNRELRQSIERLKSLDLELERKMRR
ncbi:MAG: tetratricopeptide repeat protein [Deltaproteobacteria bacterium]|nr:tetratricopeptide repeat protein [Deltaproteobacteria bacterium]